MYLDFFGFNGKPFHITPDPEFLFSSPSHKEALAVITKGIENRQGFIKLVGEIGLGKTMIIRYYLKEIEQKDNLKLVVIFNPDITFRQFLIEIYLNLNLEFRATAEQNELLDCLNRALGEEYRSNRNVAVIIDEAHNMPLETLEQLSLLSNFESSGDKLLQILLVGQPELDEKLYSDKLSELRQSISLQAELLPLTNFESVQYIKHRLMKVSTNGTPVFTDAAMRRIVKHCKGIPRQINIICDNACITALGYQKKPTSRKIVDEVIADLHGTAKRVHRPWIPIWTAAGLILLAAFTFSPLGKISLSKSLELISGAAIFKNHTRPVLEFQERQKVTVQSGPDKVLGPGEASKGSAYFGKVPSVDSQALGNVPGGVKKDVPSERAGDIKAFGKAGEGPLFRPQSKGPRAIPGTVTASKPEAPTESEKKPVADERSSKTRQSASGIPTEEVKSASEQPPGAIPATVTASKPEAPTESEKKPVADEQSLKTRQSASGIPTEEVKSASEQPPGAIPATVTASKPEAPTESEKKPVADERSSKTRQSASGIPTEEVKSASEQPPGAIPATVTASKPDAPTESEKKPVADEQSLKTRQSASGIPTEKVKSASEQPPGAIPATVTTSKPEAPKESEKKPVADEQSSKTRQSASGIPTEEAKSASEQPRKANQPETALYKGKISSDQRELEDLSEFIDQVVKKRKGR